MTVSGPFFVEPDASVVRYGPRRFDRVTVEEDDRTIAIEYGHNAIERLHHVDVVPEDDAITVTICLGITSEIAEEMERDGGVAMVAARYFSRTLATCPEQVAGRPIVDGGPPMSSRSAEPG